MVLYYFCLTCLLTNRYEYCSEIIKLSRSLYILKYKHQGYVVIDYYIAKFKNIETLVLGIQK